MPAFPWDKHASSDHSPWPKKVYENMAFVSWLEDRKVFHIAQFVPGVPLFAPPWQKRQTYRADLFLSPTETLLNQGWRFGAIVIDFNDDFDPLGQVFNRLADYIRGCFLVNGQWVCPQFGFVLNMKPSLSLDFGEVPAHQHVGMASYSDDEKTFTLASGNETILTMSEGGEVREDEMVDDPADIAHLSSLGFGQHFSV